jgi:hypothetical protein
MEEVLDEEIVIILADKLEQLQITALEVEWDWTIQGLRRLTSALRTSKLTHLGLRHDEPSMGTEEMNALVEGLKASRVVSLDLSDCPLQNDAVEVLAICLRETDLECLTLGDYAFGNDTYSALLVGVRDTAVMTLVFSGQRNPHNPLLEEWYAKIQKAVKANRDRSFILQMQVEGEPDNWTFTFRTMCGSVAAVLRWRFQKSGRNFRGKVLHAMRESGFQLPSRHIRARHLRVIRPDGQQLRCSVGLAQQLGYTRKRRLSLRWSCSKQKWDRKRVSMQRKRGKVPSFLL